MAKESIFHIYVNKECIKANLHKEEFDKEMQILHSFLELTNMESAATIEYEECEVATYAEASF